MKINDLWGKLIVLALVAVLVGVWAYFGIYCLSELLFDIPCAGCGMTRAYLALLRLDLSGAFEMHPMFWSVPILLLFYLFDGKVFRKKWINTAILVLIFAGFFVNWIFKIINI